MELDRAAAKTGGFLWQRPDEHEYVCFPLPKIEDINGDQPEERNRSARVPLEFAGTESELLRALSESERAALGRILPSLSCGEESAVHAFSREGKRTTSEGMRASRELLYQIAGEEEQHELLLRMLRRQCPVPDDLVEIRKRAQWFFLGIASRDPATHFATIAGLDSAVCILMSMATQPKRSLAKIPVLLAIFDRIRTDEARHVKFSRTHSLHLGMRSSELAACTEKARIGLANILFCLAEEFEELGMDPDLLFARIRHEISK